MANRPITIPIPNAAKLPRIPAKIRLFIVLSASPVKNFEMIV